jgi:hypothetical protein
MMVGGGGGGGLGFDYYSSPGFGFEAPWVPPPYDPYISFGLFPGSWQSYLKATGMWETFLFNQFHSFFFSHLTFGSGGIEVEEGAGAGASFEWIFGKGTKEIEGRIRVYEMIPEHQLEVTYALTMMCLYGGPEGVEAAMTIANKAVLWEYDSGARFGPGMTSKNWKDVAIDFEDLIPYKVGWGGRVHSEMGALIYTLAHESWHVRNRKGDWGFWESITSIGRSSVNSGNAPDQYGWKVHGTWFWRSRFPLWW